MWRHIRNGNNNEDNYNNNIIIIIILLAHVMRSKFKTMEGVESFLPFFFISRLSRTVSSLRNTTQFGRFVRDPL